MVPKIYAFAKVPELPQEKSVTVTEYTKMEFLSAEKISKVQFFLWKLSN